MSTDNGAMDSEWAAATDAAGGKLMHRQLKPLGLRGHVWKFHHLSSSLSDASSRPSCEPLDGIAELWRCSRQRVSHSIRRDNNGIGTVDRPLRRLRSRAAKPPCARHMSFRVGFPSDMPSAPTAVLPSRLPKLPAVPWSAILPSRSTALLLPPLLRTTSRCCALALAACSTMNSMLTSCAASPDIGGGLAQAMP